ncbi:MAG: Stp1/IreP family PP2C-type Ser/Thr phosphatase [Coriobacteriales bacterium]|jgi:serine/threonine protein phosphatase PrpC|nr:Stp1/IreP family PP2C-type Ser/Thr phosphatase [Coriobacteriales bacterium]
MSSRQNEFAFRTEVGYTRAHNEDALVAQPPLYAVADGMGGHEAGEVASEIAINTLVEYAPLINNSQTLIDTVAKINQAIIDAAASGRGQPNMGTTLTAAILDGDLLLIAQVGDSRAYLLRGGRLQQLTRDHSYVGELLAGGHISEQDAATHPKRAQITRALGSDPKTEADIYEVELALGDRLLLCSDGLNGMVSDSDIERLLRACDGPQEATDALVEAALAAGGRDNVSVIVIDVNNTKSVFLHDAPPAAIQRGFLKKRRVANKQQSQAGPANNGEPEWTAPAYTPNASRQKASSNKSTKGTRAATASEHDTRRGVRIHLGVLTFALLVVLLIAGAVGGIWLYASNSTFVRANEGKVAVYRGLPGDILPGIRLEWLEYQTEVAAYDLLPSTAQRLQDGIQVDSLSAASSLIEMYKQQIAQKGITETAS